MFSDQSGIDAKYWDKSHLPGTRWSPSSLGPTSTAAMQRREPGHCHLCHQHPHHHPHHWSHHQHCNRCLLSKIFMILSKCTMMSRVLLEDRQFLKDVTFGKTKVFVRYSLEEESDYKSNLRVYGFLKICSSGLRPLCLSLRRLDLSWSPASSSSCRRCAGAAWPGKSTGRASYDDNMTTFNDQEDGGGEVGLGKVPQVQNENVSRPLIILTLPCIHRLWYH